jgi:signal transduction histidine kinase
LNPLGWSLRRQIAVLGGLLLVVVGASGWFSVASLRQSQAARAADAASNMDRVTRDLAERFEYVQGSLDAEHARHALADEALLRSLAAATLFAAPGLEGGFFRAGDERLLGYAYPTYHGSGPKTDVPAAEQPTIVQIARQAVVTRKASGLRVAAGPDLLLFRAEPIRHNGDVVGASWVMQRLQGAQSPEQRLWTLGSVALLLVLAVVATLAWMVTYRLDRGVARIETGLRTREARLDMPVDRTHIPELDRIGAAINDLLRIIESSQGTRRDLERRLDRADRLAALGRLVAGVAHEVRNPLASIRLKLHLAQQLPPTPERLTAAFTVIQQEVERLDRLVERLLTLAKPGDSAATPIDLDRLVRARVSLWEGRAAERGIAIETRKGSTAPEPMVIDGDRVAQILDNLIANALEALNERGGRITLALEQPAAGEILIGVADTGPGVAPEHVDRLFEPFFTTRAGGTGLGLFLSAELARAMGGEVRYRPHGSGGASFEVRLPC